MGWFLSFILSVAVTAIAYLLFPGVIVLTGKKMTKRGIRRVVIWNAIVVASIFAIIRASNGIQGTNAAVFLWSAVANAILRNYSFKDEETEQKR